MDDRQPITGARTGTTRNVVEWEAQLRTQADTIKVLREALEAADRLADFMGKLDRDQVLMPEEKRALAAYRIARPAADQAESRCDGAHSSGGRCTLPENHDGECVYEKSAADQAGSSE